VQLFGQRTSDSPHSNKPGFVMAYSQVQGTNGQPVGLHVGQESWVLHARAVPVLSKLARNYVVCDHCSPRAGADVAEPSLRTCGHVGRLAESPQILLR